MSQTSLESGYSSDNCASRSPNNFMIEKDQRKFARNFEVTDLLAESANGIIYNGIHIRSGKSVVIKQIPRKIVQDYFEIDGRMVPSEIYLHFHAYAISKTVVKPIAWFEKRSSFVLVMEKVQNAIDLWEFSNTFGAIPENAAVAIFSQIFKCAEKLHDGGIVHRDFKDENILINPETLEIKVIDFGCAEKIKENEALKTASGTLEYFPPEWFKYCEMDVEKSTIWSLGAIFYILLTGTWDFENGNLQRNIIAEAKISTETKKLLDSLLCHFPSKRASFKSVISSNILNC